MTPGNGCPDEASVVVESVFTTKECVSLKLSNEEFSAVLSKAMLPSSFQKPSPKVNSLPSISTSIE